MAKKSGFTLVELLITLAILAIVVAALTRLFMSTNKVYNNNQAILRVQQEVRLASSLLANDLRMLGSDAMSVDGFCDTIFYKCEDVYFLKEDPDKNDEPEKQAMSDSSGDQVSGRLNDILLMYYDSNGDFTSNISDAIRIKYKVCGSPPDDTPYLSDDYEFCTESVIVTRNLHY